MESEQQNIYMFSALESLIPSGRSSHSTPFHQECVHLIRLVRDTGSRHSLSSVQLDITQQLLWRRRKKKIRLRLDAPRLCDGDFNR